jgi:hypothetical protein
LFFLFFVFSPPFFAIIRVFLILTYLVHYDSFCESDM